MKFDFFVLNLASCFDFTCYLIYPGPPKALDDDETEFLDTLASVSI